MAAYWPPFPVDMGPTVLFAWHENGEWVFGVGYGTWPLRGIDDEAKPTYWVSGWDVTPEYFAYITPPI